MSKRSDLLVACMLGNRWRATSVPAAGTTAVATSPTPADLNSRVHLEALWYSIRNEVGAGAIIQTVGVQIRGSLNTVLASIEHLVPISTTANVNISNLGFANPKKGTSLNVFMNTVIASVTQAVNAFGWIEDTNG